MQQCQDSLTFRKPWKSRIGSALFALLLACGYPALLFFEPSNSKVPMDPLGRFCFGILEVVCLPFAAFFLYLSGPQHLSFDLNRRTYRLDRANRLAEEIASMLDVPLVEPPFPTRSPRAMS